MNTNPAKTSVGLSRQIIINTLINHLLFSDEVPHSVINFQLLKSIIDVNFILIFLW